MEQLLLATPDEWRLMSEAARSAIRSRANVDAMISGLVAAIRHAAEFSTWVQDPAGSARLACAELRDSGGQTRLRESVG